MRPHSLTVSALAVATLSASTQEFPASKKLSRFAEVNAKALEDGTLVKFDHPTTFSEFFEREPKYVAKWLRSKRCPEDMREDFEQELLMHLMRAPGEKSEHFGKPDWISTYDPELMGGFGTRWAWAAFVNRMLTTQYGKLITRNNRGGVRGPQVISLTPDPWALGAGLPQAVLQNSEALALFTTAPVAISSKIFMERFMLYVQERLGQDHVTYLRALVISTSLDEVEAVTGLPRSRYDRYRRDLKELAAKFSKRRRAHRIPSVA